MRRIKAPFAKKIAGNLRAGDRLALSGRLVTVRDASLQKIFRTKRRDSLAIFAGQVVFFAGPAPAPPGRISGSIGPTTTARMGRFIPGLVRAGARALVGKGDLLPETREVLVENGVPYLVAVGGAAAFLAKAVTASRVIAFPELGTEAVREIAVRSFPLIVALDSRGDCLFDRFR